MNAVYVEKVTDHINNYTSDPTSLDNVTYPAIITYKNIVTDHQNSEMEHTEIYNTNYVLVSEIYVLIDNVMIAVYKEKTSYHNVDYISDLNNAVISLSVGIII